MECPLGLEDMEWPITLTFGCSFSILPIRCLVLNKLFSSIESVR